MQTGEVAKRVRASENSVRNWARAFGKEFLSKAGRGGRSRHRLFTEADVLVLATIADRSRLGFTYAQIAEILRTGERAESIPPLPSPEEEEARERVELVPLSDLELWQERVENFKAELVRAREMYLVEVERLTGERDSEREKVEERDVIIRDLERTLGQAEGELETLKKKRGLFGRSS